MAKTIETQITIHAPVKKVWDTLLDTASWKDWNPSFCFIGSPFKVGEPVEVHLKMSDRKPVIVHPVITALDHQKHEIVWKGVLGGAAWVFHGYHYFKLIEKDANTTQFIHEENMKGLVVPMVRLSGQVKATREEFIKMNETLKSNVKQPSPQRNEKEVLTFPEMEFININSIGEVHASLGLGKPLHPLITVIREWPEMDIDFIQVKFVSDLFIIANLYSIL